jgi:hypothetical protein
VVIAKNSSAPIHTVTRYTTIFDNYRRIVDCKGAAIGFAAAWIFTIIREDAVIYA